MTTLLHFATWVAPLVVIGVTVGLWALLILLDSPRPYWRDTFNISLGGMLALFSLYVLEEAGQHAGLWDRDPVDVQILVLAAGAFAAIGLPRTIREVRAAIDRKAVRP